MRYPMDAPGAVRVAAPTITQCPRLPKYVSHELSCVTLTQETIDAELKQIHSRCGSGFQIRFSNNIYFATS
jgi:hypothetical protein